MKTTSRIFRSVSFLLTFLILFQSCRVYKREMVTLDDAISEGKRVKIRAFDNMTYTYRSVEKVDGIYYGIKMKRKEMIRTPIDTNNIKKVKLHNKTMSIIYGTLIGAVAAFVVAGVIVVATWDFDVIGGSLQFPN